MITERKGPEISEEDNKFARSFAGVANEGLRFYLTDLWDNMPEKEYFSMTQLINDIPWNLRSPRGEGVGVGVAVGEGVCVAVEEGVDVCEGNGDGEGSCIAA